MSVREQWRRRGRDQDEEGREEVKEEGKRE